MQRAKAWLHIVLPWPMVAWCERLYFAQFGEIELCMVKHLCRPDQDSIDVGANNASRMLGPTVGGWLADRYGRKFVFMASAICAGSLAYVYTHVPFSNNLMLVLGFPLGFFASAYYSAILPFLNEAFPTAVRGSGVGFTYNAGRAIGGGFPFLVGAVSAVMPLSDAISLFAAASYGLMLATAACMTETNGTALRA